VSIYELLNGKSSSCGCKNYIGERSRTHGMSNTRFIGIWRAMHRRCYDETYSGYENWGSRGITVCNSWHDFDSFKNDMHDTYDDALTLDRIDVNGNYCKSNCRWTTYVEQAYNRRKKSTNTSGKTGVSFHIRIKKWAAKITKNGVQYGLGYYDKIEDAIAARNEAEIKFFGYNKE
jgi:hypothetical protein